MIVSVCGVASVVGALSVPITLGLGPQVVPVRIHAAEAWGRPAVDAQRVYFLSKRHELIAVTRNSGAEEWRASLGGATPLTAGTTVVIAGTSVVAGDGDLFGFDRATGSLKWRFTSPQEDAPGRYLGAAIGGLVLTGSRSGRVYAIDAESGVLRWASPILGDRVLVYPPVADGGSAEATSDGENDEQARREGHSARDACRESEDRGRDGNCGMDGKQDGNDDHGAIAAAYADFSTNPRTGGVVLLDAAQGSMRWRTTFPRRGPDIAAGGAGIPVVFGPIVAAASSDGTVYGFARRSGAIVWTVPPVGSLDPEGSGTFRVEDVRALASARGTLVVTSLTGTLVAVDPGTGREQWRSVPSLDGSIAFAAVTDLRVAYLPYVSGRLAAVDLASGMERWRVGGPGLRFEHPPAVSEHRVYATSEEGLYAVDDLSH